MDQIQVIIFSFFRLLFPDEIWNGSYLFGLWHKYSNVKGFLIGAFVIGIVFFASDFNDDKEFINMIRIFATIALINAIDGIYIFIMNLVNSVIFNNIGSRYEDYIQGAFNPLSLMLVIIVITECYKNKPEGAFFFGLSTFSVSTLLFTTGITDLVVISYLVLRVLFIAIICSICSKINYGFISFFVAGLYLMIEEAVKVYLLGDALHSGETGFINDILTILGTYRAEYVILIFIFVMFALFELFVLTNKKLNKENIKVGQIILAIMVSLGSVALLYVAVFKIFPIFNITLMIPMMIY